MKSYTLNNGVSIPVLGFGTWKAENGEVAYQAVLEALKAGYRHIVRSNSQANHRDKRCI